MEELEAEVEELREKNEVLQREIAVLIEEKDAQLSQFEGKLEKNKEDIEKEWRIKLRELDNSSRKELEAMAAELDIMRAAFQGDSSGWVVKKTKSGREYYENLDTGETREEMPEVLYVAEAMQKADRAGELMEEVERLKEKFKEAELKKREAETTTNKLRTEINSLREIDRGWKETSRTMSKHLMSVVVGFDKQADEIVSGIHSLGNEAIKVTGRSSGVRKVTQYLLKLKNKITAQEEKISHLNSTNRRLQNDLDEALAKVKRLSNGIEEEVERMVKPMRDKLTDCMLQSMKEKAQRLQERRHLADLWPTDHIMPTSLLQYRSLNNEEIARRVERSREIEASKALMLEIRHNVSESRKWTIQYDEYGRQYFQHSVTGETNWEQPEIMTYKPPPGRDDMGNLTVTEDDLEKGWIMKCDSRGMVYYQSEATNEIRYEPPAAFRKIPPGRSPELFVGEAANIVLSFIKGKISKHVGILKRLKARENGEVLEETEETQAEDEEFKANKEDLSKYLYDIETVEQLAEVFEKNILAVKSNTKQGNKKDEVKDIFVDERDKIALGYEANVGLLEHEGLFAKKEQYMGPTLADVDITEAGFGQIKDIVELYATMEEKLERRLKETRSHLKVPIPLFPH
jgi:FtsZ-binding cell division protein ZapB